MLTELAKKPLVMALLILAGGLVMLYWLRGTLMPLLIGATLAYIFMPLVERWSGGRLSRRVVAALIVIGSMGTLTALALWVFPQVSEEARNVGDNLLTAIGKLERYYPRLQARYPALPAPTDPLWRDKLRDEVIGHLAPLRGMAGSLLAGGFDKLSGLLGVALELLFVPVFFFYLLVDGPALLAAAERRVPGRAAPVFAQLVDTIDSTLRAYVRSAAKVVVMLVFVYAVLFLGLRMPLALPLALLCAAAHWVPYVGTAVSAAAAAALALVHFGPDARVAIAPLAIFAIHLTEVVFITPRFVGKGVGLHPLITIVALLLGVRFLGLGGLILALPVAAVVAGLLPIVLPEHPAAAPPPPPS